MKYIYLVLATVIMYMISFYFASISFNHIGAWVGIFIYAIIILLTIIIVSKLILKQINKK